MRHGTVILPGYAERGDAGGPCKEPYSVGQVVVYIMCFHFYLKISTIRSYLLADSVKLRMLCANAIFRLAEEDESRNLVRMHGGLEKLVEMMKDDLNKPKAQSNMPVMAAVTGALWKCATNNLDNVDRLQVQ